MNSDEPRTTIELSITCATEAVARSLQLTLHPDNKGFPKGQNFHEDCKDRILSISIRSAKVMPALTTLESLLSDIRVFHEVWQIE